MISKRHLTVAAVVAVAAAVRVSRRGGSTVVKAILPSRLRAVASALAFFFLILNWKNWPLMWHVRKVAILFVF
jgi:hypothetical protein